MTEAPAPSVPVCFNEADLWRHVVPKASVPGDGITVIVADYARSSSPESDETALLAARVSTDISKEYFVLEIIADRWNVRDLPFQIVQLAMKHGATKICVERLSNWELLEDAIVHEAHKREVNLSRIQFFKADKLPMAKSNRIAKFYQLCESGAVKFVRGNYLNKLFDQLCRFTFERANRGRADDCADACGLLISHN